jgi:hypothetical protein
MVHGSQFTAHGSFVVECRVRQSLQETTSHKVRGVENPLEMARMCEPLRAGACGPDGWPKLL